MSDLRQGSAAAFDENWRGRQEALYTHWTRGEPANQIQLAFRNHWTLFQQLAGPFPAGTRVLEVGCGRGSMSAYFADAGCDCTLLDLSPAVIDTARAIFAANQLPARFEVGDCRALPFADGSFDVVVSIGLLEHFDDITPVLAEQVRILAPDGRFLGYVVPHLRDNVQADYAWVNDLLRAVLPPETVAATADKAVVFRSDELSPRYLPILADLGLQDVQASGVYPLPMISHSPAFPFTLLPPPAEAVLVRHFTAVLAERAQRLGHHPWRCPEGEGQAFLCWGTR